MSTAIVWTIITAQVLATVLFLALAAYPAALVAILLTVPASVGLARRTLWGRALAIAFSCFAIVLSLLLVIPDRESLTPSGVEAIIHRSASTTELYLGVALAVAPWLICIHMLVRNKRLFRNAAW